MVARGFSFATYCTTENNVQQQHQLHLVENISAVVSRTAFAGLLRKLSNESQKIPEGKNKPANTILLHYTKTSHPCINYTPFYFSVFPVFFPLQKDIAKDLLT